ncbi:MAG: hypothetical protein KKD36_08220 [Bacteroidetes bacterium]|nr:hypothetical protein [Bacteroidota bacterium]
MELSKIKQLINKYLEGQSSLEEETILRNYFASEVIDSTLQEYQPIFNYYTTAKDIKSLKEHPALPLIQTNKKIRTWISIAASIIVFLGAGTYLFLQINNNNADNLGTYDDPEVALRETQKALALLSNHVNTGVEGMRYMQEFENSKNKIFNPITKNK